MPPVLVQLAPCSEHWILFVDSIHQNCPLFRLVFETLVSISEYNYLYKLRYKNYYKDKTIKIMKGLVAKVLPSLKKF